VSALQRVDWRIASLLLAVILLGAAVAAEYSVDWARLGRVGSSEDKVIVTGLSIAVVALLGLLLSNRRTTGALLVPPAVVGALVVFSGASGVAFGGPNEPLLSPASTVQGDEIRDIALAARAEKGGTIVIHPSFSAQFIWPMRDSGQVTIASRVPADATVVLWPASDSAPDGFAVVSGQWSFVEDGLGPSGDFLDYLRWLSDRNSLKNTRSPIAVYIKAGP
jgi:hypothetical protein